jgi:NAD(P)-dependent dehydrogenase (short-subunit alcohol dehydrogenase family)
MGRLQGKAAVIAGCDNVVGQAVAAACRRDGATVSELPPLPPDEEAWAEALSRHGRADLIVNARHLCRVGDITAVDAAAFMAEFDAIATQAWLCQKHGIALLRRGGGGVLIHVASVLARVAAPGCAAVCAAARGVLMSSKSAALECARAKDNVIVSAVLAGRIEGDPDHWPDGRLLPRAPAVSPADVADGVIFLATDGAGYMTGVELPVDGGFLAS